MKKKSLVLLLSLGIVLAGLVGFAMALLPSLLRPQPHIPECEVVNSVNVRRFLRRNIGNRHETWESIIQSLEKPLPI